MDINWLALILMLLAIYGVYEHAVAMYDAMLDERAMQALKHDGLAMYAVCTDIRDEKWRMIAKIMFALFFFIAMFNPNSTANADLGIQGWLAFIALFLALVCLTINTNVRKRARNHMLRDTLIHKGRAV